MLPNLRRKRRGLDEDAALYVPARPGRETPLEDRELRPALAPRILEALEEIPLEVTPR